MDTKKIESLAQKMAQAAKNGVTTINGKRYTFEFDQREWHYVVYEDMVEILRLNTKKLSQAKQWLKEYLAN